MLARVLALLLLAGGVLAPVPSAVARGDDDRPIRLLRTERLFSPNGDGRQDAMSMRFRLSEPAHVRVLVRVSEGSRRVRHADLGVLSAGEHAWVWRGRDDAGRPAPNDAYRVVLTAANRTQSGSIHVIAGLDRGERVRDARVWLSRRTIYPETPGVVPGDRLHFFATTGRNIHFRNERIRSTLQIRDRDGDIVRRRMTLEPEAVWAARDESGARVPPGEYDVAVTFRDYYGNRRTTTRVITVSDQSLVPETWSTTVRAADAEQIPMEHSCAPTPSERFDGGLTLAVTDGCERTVFRPRVDVPFRLDPLSSWRVSVTGGPTTPGGGDAGAVWMDYWSAQTATAPGDATTTTDWVRVLPYQWHAPSDQAFWVVVDDPGASYDVAEYTVEVRHYVPPPG